MEKENFTDIILLIGTNPLPNYVTAKYFISINHSLKNIFLVYSEKTSFQQSTKVFAEKIKNMLCLNDSLLSGKFSFFFIPLNNVDNAQSVRNDFHCVLNKINSKSTVHLNYTGGTKVMCVQIHEMLSENNLIKKGFSYLSSKWFCLIDDNGNHSEDLRKIIKLSFKDLIELHDYERKNEDQAFLFNDALEVIVNLINKEGIDKYYDMNGGYNRKNFINEKDSLICKKKDLVKKNKYLTVAGSFLDSNNALPDEYKLFDKNGNLKAENGHDSGENIKNVLKFFGGGWLEIYIYKILSGEFINHANIKVYNNWVIKKPEWNNLDFELDVILMKGYQLFGISCTTGSEKALCKSKGFEIILRTQQIGGDESKAILITLAEDNKVTAIQEELSIETGSQKNILVLGKNDLKKDYIIKKIKNFMGD
jgi:hypothetical protein